MNATVQLNELLRGINGVDAEVSSVAVKDVTLDSRKITANDAFVAVKGESSDGSKFINAAINNGASVILVDDSFIERISTNKTPLVKINQLKKQLPKIADNCYGNPSAAMTLIAVTGTNGKTTCAHLIAQALKRLSVSSAIIGTAGQGLIDDLSATSLTTPDVFELRKLLAQFKKQNVEAVAFEASSHGLDQGRLDDLKIDLAVFTNLSHDHLDYHNDLNEYTQAKLKLFQFASLSNAVMNADHPLVDDFAEQTSAKKVWFYGQADTCDVRLINSVTLENGLALTIQTRSGQFEFTSKLIGKINIENLLAVFTTLLAYGYREENICAVISQLKSVPGRMEVFGGGTKPMVIVDYAHTPDALEKALISLQDHLIGKLFCVFGCGGDRDKEKRPKMGRAVEKYADIPVITDDNPRHEKSEDIIQDIVVGMSGRPKIISDRPGAIGWAINQAKKGDIVLIAGKGHEATQQIGDEYIAMSDRELVARILESGK